MLGRLDHRVRPELLDLRVRLVQRVPKASRDRPGLKDRRASLDLPGCRDPRAIPVLREFKGPLVRWARRGSSGVVRGIRSPRTRRTTPSSFRAQHLSR